MQLKKRQKRTKTDVYKQIKNRAGSLAFTWFPALLLCPAAFSSKEKTSDRGHVFLKI